MVDNQDNHILELKIQTAVIEEKVITLENYMLKELKEQLENSAKKAESRFRWTVAMLVTFMCTSVIVPLVICGGV